MYNWLFTEEEKEIIRADFSAFEKAYPHFEEDAYYKALKRLYQLLVNKENQMNSMVVYPFDLVHYHRFIEDRNYLKRVIWFLKTHVRCLREGRFWEIYLDRVTSVVEEVLKTLNCQSLVATGFSPRYSTDKEPFNSYISEFQGYSDILYYCLSQSLPYEDYRGLVRSYQIYQNELILAQIQQRNMATEDVVKTRKNPFDVLYHQMCLEKNGQNGSYLQQLELACSYGDKALTFVIEECDNQMRSHMSKGEYVPLMKTLSLAIEAKERGKRNL